MTVNNATLFFVNNNEEVFLKSKLTALPLKEECIISKSMEYYFDPEPCMIHRSAVMKRIYMQIEEFLDQKLAIGEQKIAWTDFPDFIKEALVLEQGVKYVIPRLT